MHVFDSLHLLQGLSEDQEKLALQIVSEDNVVDLLTQVYANSSPAHLQSQHTCVPQETCMQQSTCLAAGSGQGAQEGIVYHAVESWHPPFLEEILQGLLRVLQSCSNVRG